MPLDDTVQQLRRLKAQRSRQRELRDFEERMLLDDLQETDRKLKGSPRSLKQRKKLQLSKDKAIRDLQIQYERERERNLFGERKRDYTRQPDIPRYNHSTDPKAQQLAESHGRNMEQLQNRNRDLERQREEIRRRLEELGRRPIKDDDTMNALLQELKDQEARNQKMLEELRRLMATQYNYPMPVETKKQQQYMYPIYYGNSLVAEIIAVRQTYLQNGGNDPSILQQLAQMQAEAQAIDDSLRNRPPPKQKDKHPPDHSLLTLELENERLQRQLLLLQEQNLQARNRRKDDREDELERDIRRLQQDHLRKMYELQREIERLRQETIYLKVNEKPPKIILHQPPPIQVSAPAPPAPIVQPQIIEVDRLAPYDYSAGFCIFYDFVLNLDPRITAVRLIVGLHNLQAKLGEPSILPLVYTEPSTRQVAYSLVNAVIGARQPVPRCPPESDLGIVVELQAAGSAPGSEHDQTRLITRAWTKIPLFDSQDRLMTGRHRLPLRAVPLKPYIPMHELNTIPQYGEAELYYRIVNMRDAQSQSMATIAATNQDMYQVAPVGGVVLTQVAVSPVPPPPSVSPPGSPMDRFSPRLRNSNRPLIQNLNTTLDPNIGFQVDRVKHAELGEGKVRLTAYYQSNGKIVQSATSPVMCTTTAVRSNFKYFYHVFGQQEASFQDVKMTGDMILVARFYLKKQIKNQIDETEAANTTGPQYGEEALVAWSAIPLVLSMQGELTSRERREFNPSTMRINAGTHILKLYEPPVPEPTNMPYDTLQYYKDARRYGKATVRIHIFQGQPRPGSLTPSELSDEGDDVLPEFAWLPCDRRTPPSEPFHVGDGFDIYIDGCRFLPDSVTYSRVAARILDRKYEVHGKDISTSVKIDSDIFNPVYEHRAEFREPQIPPSATLLFKVYTIDNFYRQLTVVGYAALKIFVESGTERQPGIDRAGVQISLNEGPHQLRLYSQGPNGVDPFTEKCMADANVRPVPCASLLVRIAKVPKGPKGKPLVATKVPQADWARLGLWYPRPKYSDRVYFSSQCVPSRGESKLFHAMMKRVPITIRDAVAATTKAKESFLSSDKNMEQYIRNQLTKSMDTKPLDQDLNFISQYSPLHGTKLALDSAVNLPWANFTLAHVCLNPPGAFYMGAPHATYDKLTFIEYLDPRSTHTSPAWKDGFKHFPRRSYHRFLVAIIHLQEVFVNVSRDNYKYGLLEQAWTAVQIFKDKYCYTETFQLPLFQGAPNQQMLKQLAREPCKEWMERNIRNRTLKLLDGASVFIRLCDARRDDELLYDVPASKLVHVNVDYIPRNLAEIYSRERPGRPLESLIPPGKSSEQFMEGLKVKFKSLVYKLYEEGNMSNN
ncbi:uncharacterized protein LOC106067643 isoform X1 [Biomphalaria glabrata]|uniref:Uncharacterized protein LOC106067643 isoform X1 n=1 Tax=Biomphalaria glabrata TaxID=6526 RepID=A0A2C9LBM3_BIOGL|nr:uncharacterized protein LOC106067643 isoform X1 [Biomphalaria glabrata]XP_013082309.1 uncharacterized protein LOC106067643 isoform X1 [Biomphalaria glabrata]XP_013082310.1 uncharacterized protein LOC106067643 isoform X1 [Biomphalaria glabrata]XP_055886833.1 uncharacterized protein LOC106067643 isoform X1 [Biomphalaria glabrata]XP_055886834.1 uncharacterized protein LOC106067643 isoform X1 [Biomphalaria glabrata]XP_055886835.1 uncharacterized protein LOC106067643 isoform X1 [Biomphalaria gla